MRLKILVPTEILVDQSVEKVVAEAENGSFCLLPRHVDFLAALVPGLLSYEDHEGRETFVAVGRGLLVKQSDEVLVSVSQAIVGGDLGQLQQTVEQEFSVLDERQKAAHSAVAKLESSFLRRFLELQESAS